jgi:hypothetical protein
MEAGGSNRGGHPLSVEAGGSNRGGHSGFAAFLALEVKKQAALQGSDSTGSLSELVRFRVRVRVRVRVRARRRS